MTMPQVRGIVFDLDGTLVDSRLDFDAMRRDMGMAAGVPILEALAAIPPGPEYDRMYEIVHRHELQGADLAEPFAGVLDFLQHVNELGIASAILTRNSRESALRTLNRWNLTFSQVIAREDAPPKPDPAGVLLIAERWGMGPDEMIVIGDYLFDLQAGRRAGMRSVLFAPDELPDFVGEADYVLRHFRDAAQLLKDLDKQDLSKQDLGKEAP